MAQISGSVGVNGTNRKTDVETVQTLLNRVPFDKGGPAPALKVDGLCWQKTTAAIERFQKIGCGFKWPDRIIEPDRKTWIELEKYDEPAAPPPSEEQPKCPRGVAPTLALAPAGTSNSFIGDGKYLPAPLDKDQRNAARRVFGDSLDLDAIGVLYRTPSGAKGACLVGPLPGQNTLLLSSTAELLLIHELTHAWQSQHDSVPGMYMINAQASFNKEEKGKTSAYWYQYKPEKPFEEYAAEQIADQVENGESHILGHVRSRYMRFKDPLNMKSLREPRVQAMDTRVAKHAPAKY
jgi:hypothetical protein